MPSYIKKYLFEKRFHFSRFQFNLVAVVFIVVGLILGSYFTIKGVSHVFAANDTTKTWTFNTANAGSYTYDSSLVSVDTSAHPVTGVNKFTNPAFASDASSWSASAVSGSTTPAGWIVAPGNSSYSTTDFLVMKYEAKCAATADPTTGLTSPTTGTGGYADNTTACTSANSKQVVSVASGFPIVNVSQTNSITRCSTVSVGGSAAHLITNNEWMTLARGAEAQTANWYGGVVGTNFMFMGHNDNGPAAALAASTDDNSPYSGTNDSASSCDGVYSNFVVGDDTTSGRACVGQKRTFTLANGSVIWDLSGNVWEWTNNTIQRQYQPQAWNGTTDDNTGFNWSDFTSGGGLSRYIHSYKSGLSISDVQPSNATYNASKGVGRIYHYSLVGDTNTTVYAFRRGGGWDTGAYAGAFTLALGSLPSGISTTFGLRCASDSVAPSSSYSSSSAAPAGEILLL